MQRYFGLNLDRLGVDFGAFQAGACLSCLPLGSALLADMEPSCRWTAQEYLLHGLLCAVTGKEIPYPWDKKGGLDGIETEGLPLDEFREWYENTQWKEGAEWQEIR